MKGKATASNSVQTQAQVLELAHLREKVAALELGKSGASPAEAHSTFVQSQVDMSTHNTLDRSVHQHIHYHAASEPVHVNYWGHEDLTFLDQVKVKELLLVALAMHADPNVGAR